MVSYDFIDDYLTDRFNVDVCESYTLSQMIMYAHKQGLVINEAKKDVVSNLIRVHDFKKRFFNLPPANARITGNIDYIIICFFYLRSLMMRDVCVYIPSTVVPLTDINKAGIVWFIYQGVGRLNVPGDLRPTLINCNSRYVVVLLGIVIDKESSGHANGLIFDRIEKKIEKFDPHGVVSNTRSLPQLCDREIERYFPGYTVIPSFKTYPWLGPQIYQPYLDPSSYGFCLSWVIWFIEFRFTYPFSSQTHLGFYNQLIKVMPLDIIKSYSEHVMRRGLIEVIKNI